MSRLRKRNIRVTNVRLRKSDKAITRDVWQWVIHQSNLKLSVIAAIRFAQNRFGKGDLPSALINYAENNLVSTNNLQQTAQPMQQTSSKPVPSNSEPETQAKPKAAASPKAKPQRPRTHRQKQTTQPKKSALSNPFQSLNKDTSMSNDSSGQTDAKTAIFNNIKGMKNNK